MSLYMSAASSGVIFSGLFAEVLVFGLLSTAALAGDSTVAAFTLARTATLLLEVQEALC